MKKEKEEIIDKIIEKKKLEDQLRKKLNQVLELKSSGPQISDSEKNKLEKTPYTLFLKMNGPKKIDSKNIELYIQQQEQEQEQEQLKKQIKAFETLQTKNELTFVVSAPGSAGMETCLVNLLEPRDEVVICIHGVFGHNWPFFSKYKNRSLLRILFYHMLTIPEVPYTLYGQDL